MTKCPKCKKEVAKPEKTWKYSLFTVQAFSCNNCGTQFRDYAQKGKRSFTLKQQKGKYVKA
jgi:hydrogenase maturation factor HypF (carbamoyltransferase family)